MTLSDSQSNFQDKFNQQQISYFKKSSWLFIPPQAHLTFLAKRFFIPYYQHPRKLINHFYVRIRGNGI